MMEQNHQFKFHKAISQITRLVWSSDPVLLIIIFLIQIVQGTSPVIAAWITKKIFDLLVLIFQTGHKNSHDLIVLLVLQGTIMILYQFFEVANQYCGAELNRKLAVRTQNLFYQKINGLEGLRYFENPAFHDTLRLASQGFQESPQQLLSVFTTLLQQSVILLSFAGALLIFSPFLALLVVGVSMPRLFMQLKISYQRFDLATATSPKERRAAYLGSLLYETHYVKEVRLFGLKNYFLTRFLEIYRQIQQAQRNQQIRELRWELGLNLFSTVITTSVFFVVIGMAFSQQLTIGDVTLYTSALGSVGGALTTLVMTFSNLNQIVLFFTHFMKLLELPPDLSITNPYRPVPPLTSGIELRNVSFRYDDDLPLVLHHLNLYIPAGKCLAVVGLNGAGKTTLVKLLARFYDPVEGQILWDGIDIREFKPQELREHIGAIFQDFVHYELTARENIGVGCIERIDDLAFIKQAAADANVEKVIENLPHAYETILSRWLSEENYGMDLSGGQWQKVAAARMLIRQADFLMLDEPTAALDPAAEHELYDRFVGLISNRTSLLISHRFSTVRMADLIAVLENGHVAEYGSHNDLMLFNQTYAKLYTMQAEHYFDPNPLDCLQEKKQ